MCSSDLVVDSAGVPVAGAKLEFMAQILGCLCETSARSDAEGAFLVRGLSKGYPYTLRVYSPDVDSSAAFDVVPPVQGGKYVVDFGTSLDVYLSHRQRRPSVATTEVVLERKEDRGWFPVNETSRSRGERVTFGHLRSGTYRVLARSPGLGVGATDLVIISYRTRLKEELQLGAGRRVSGTVVDAQGDPVEGAFLNLGSEPREDTAVKTVSAGTFSIELPAVDACIVVSRTGFEPRVVPVLASETAIGNVTLPRN